MTILYAENHARFAQIAGSRFLSGHRVTVVPTVAEAVACLARERFDVVLADYDLDDGKGTEVVAAMRLRAARDERTRPVVIAVSSHAEGNAALLAAGADAVCAKAEFAHLGDVIAEAMAAARARAGG